MLTIRQEQLAVFSRAEVRKFEDWTLAHLRKFFPSQCAALGERQLRETIAHGIRRAASYGVTARSGVCRYIDLMIVFGRDFDTDARFRWAREILERRGNSTAKMKALLRAAKRRLGNR